MLLTCDLEAYVVRKIEYCSLRYHDMPRQATSTTFGVHWSAPAHRSHWIWTLGLTTEAYKAIAIAAVDVPVLAGAARSVVDDRLDTYTIARLVLGRYAFADLFDHTRKLVAKREWDLFACNRVWSRRTYRWSSEVFVQVATAYSTPDGFDLKQCELG